MGFQVKGFKSLSAQTKGFHSKAFQASCFFLGMAFLDTLSSYRVEDQALLLVP